MQRRRRFSTEINPYAGQVHAHPRTLLAEPTPAALQEALAARPAGPLEVDLGCGSGNFLLALAEQRPDARLIGFELRYKRLVKAAQKVERRGLDNVLLLREQAERLADYFGPGSVAAVYLNFPDPWPKRAHWKKRLVQPAFLAAVARTLVPGGRLHLRTDHSGYFLHCLALVAGRTDLATAAYSNDLHRYRPPGAVGIRTEFEQLFRHRHKPVYYLALEKPAGGG